MVYGKNEIDPIAAEGQRAAIGLFTTPPEGIDAKFKSLDDRISQLSEANATKFVSAMTSELEKRNLLPQLELHFAQGTKDSCDPALQTFKHINDGDHNKVYTDGDNGMTKTADKLQTEGKFVEGALMHSLTEHQSDLESAHAERNVWGKNHGGTDMDRLQRWAGNSKPDFTGVSVDQPSNPPASPEANNSQPNDVSHPAKPCPPDAPDYAAKVKDDESRITALQGRIDASDKRDQDRTHTEKHRQDVEAGVRKDAHHKVQHGDSLYSLAQLSLKKMGWPTNNPADIQHEADKIRFLNGLEPHEQLRSGTNIMLRTDAEVSHETQRRLGLESAANQHKAKSPADNDSEHGDGSHTHKNRPGTAPIPFTQQGFLYANSNIGDGSSDV